MQQNIKRKLNFFNWILEIYGWLRIFASPFLIGVAIGVAVYIYKTDELGFIIAVSIASIGTIIGIIWATKIWKKKSTIDYVSSIMSSYDFDNFDKEDNDKVSG